MLATVSGDACLVSSFLLGLCFSLKSLLFLTFLLAKLSQSQAMAPSQPSHTSAIEAIEINSLPLDPQEFGEF